MKNIKNIFTLLVVALVGLSLTACSEDDLDTNQYLGGVSLNAFGPNPVMRGGTIRFVGSNLDQIASINIPGVGDITNYETVKAGVPSEIRVSVPKDGPEVGFITLKTKTDQTLTTKSEITYIEGIEVTGFTPATAMPGDVVTIEGDYLNLVHSLSFADNVVISENAFTEHTRYVIKVAVPEEAKTGKIELYDADLTILEDDNTEYQIIESEAAIEIGLPAITSLKGRNTVDALGTIVAKAGETLTVTGTYFNVVADVTIGGVSATDVTVSDDGTTVTFTLPAEAPDGDINLVCKSGVEVPVGTLTTVKPTNTVATPNPVKAGTELTISGQDMDLVVSVSFPTADATVDGGEIEAAADKVVVKAVPAEAVEGDLQLVMANGATVAVPFTLVKPTVTGYDNATVSAGAALTIQGTDLDLVAKVQFGDGTTEVSGDDLKAAADGSSITLTVPMDAQSGSPVLTLANGVKVAGAELTVDEALFCYITQLPEFTDDTTPSAGDVFTVPVKNYDKLTNVFVNDIEVKYAYAEKSEMLTFGIPLSAKAKSVVKLVSSNGEIEYTISVVPVGEITTVLWEGPEALDWSTSIQIPAHTFDNLSADDENTLIISYTADSDEAAAKFYDGHWQNVAIPGYYVGGDGSMLLALPKSATSVQVPITAEFLAALTNPNVQDWGASLIFHGSGATINSVKLSTKVSLETTLWTGSEEIDWNVGGAMSALSWGGYDWASVKSGSTLRVYYEKKTPGEWGCLSLRHGQDWGNLPGNFASQYDFPEDAGVYEATLSQDVIDDLAANGQGLIITGYNFVIKKVTLQ